MSTAELKKAVGKKVKALEKEWNEIAEKERSSKRPADYLEVGAVQGKIDAYLDVLTMLS